MGMVMVMAIEKGTFRAKGVDNTAEISTWHLERFAPGFDLACENDRVYCIDNEISHLRINQSILYLKSISLYSSSSAIVSLKNHGRIADQSEHSRSSFSSRKLQIAWPVFSTNLIRLREMKSTPVSTFQSNGLVPH